MKHSFHPAIRVTALSKCATAILLMLMLVGGSTTASSVSARAGAPDEATAMNGLAGPGSLSVVQVTTSPADDASPALVQTADGKLLAVFVRTGELWSRASTDEGAIWASETRIDGCCRSNPSLARAADGTLWLIYDIERVIEIEIAPGVVEVRIIREIWHRTSADGGVTWSEASRFATDASDANSDTNASMFQAANGELWAVWVSNRTGNADLWYKTRGNASATWSADTRLTTSSADDYAPTITQAADGRLVVVWSRGDGVLVQRSSTDGGATWSVERQIAGCCRRDPSLAAVGGVLWLAYEEDEDIWYRTSTNQGANWSVATPFTRFVKNDGGVTLAALASGEPGLAWHSIRSGNQDIWFGNPGSYDPGPPYIDWIEHRPQCNLDSNATITFRARALDETGVAGVHLVWTLNGDAQADLEMYDDGDSGHGDEVAGDDVWAVRHAPLPEDSHVTYRACVTDTEGNSYCHPGWNSFTVLPAFVAAADILFVPDAGGGDTSWFRSYYTSALDALGYTYDTWDTGRRCAPDSTILNRYIGGTVIWSAPNWNSYITGDSAQPAAVQSYLDAGGRLFITGQNVAQNLAWYGGANFLNNYLHATFRREDSGQYAVVCDDLVLNISGDDGANNQYSKDAVDPLTPAEAVCTYQTGANAMLAEPIRPAEEGPTGPQDLHAAPTLGTPAPAATPAPPTVAPPTPTPAPPIDPYTAGLRVDTGVYKVVYFAFGFEAINSAAHRAEMMGRVLSWLTGKMVLLAPANEQTVPAGPVAFRWTDVGAAAYEIQIDAVDTFDSPDLIDEIVDGASYTHSFTALGARYWRVRARFNDDWGDWTTIRSFSVAAGAVQATTDTADDASPALVQTADGKLLTVFVRNGSLWSRASTDSGATWGSETRIAGCCRYNPSLARAADGTLWLAYDRDGAIWYRTSADGGITWGAEQQIPTDLAVNSDPVIFHAADGKLWAVWQSYSPSYGCGGIRYATSANHGATWSALGQLFQHGYCSQTPAATVAADGRLVVVWIWDGELWQRSSTDDGATWSEERRIAFWPALQTQPWNGTVGGLVALDVAATLDLNSSTINADAAGFRGGVQRIRRGSAVAGLATTDYRTPTSVAANGQKGEGIAGTPVWRTGDPDTVGDGYPGGDFGRGAPGNAGGGGTDGRPTANDQNSGGGGGGNAGVGGLGGNTWSSNLARGGFGGAAVASAVDRAVLGGGGGAGSDNDGVLSSSGARGGGLVLVRAGRLSGTGTITANGAAGSISGQDGAGGGGAGGSVIVTTSSGGAASGFAGLTVTARGGAGGNETNGSPHGPGGGGGGGFVLTTEQPAAASSVAGGANGLHVPTNGAYGAGPGSIGTTVLGPIDGTPGTTAGSRCIDVSITKTLTSAGFVPGTDVTYSVVVTNNGPHPVTGTTPITVDDPVPAAISSVTWTCVASSGSTCAATSGTGSPSTIANLALNGSATYTITGRLAAAFTGPLTNTVTATPPTGVTELSPADNTASATSSATPRTNLSITKTDGATIATPGTDVTYTIVVGNAGPSSVSNAPVIDALPPARCREPGRVCRPPVRRAHRPAGRCRSTAACHLCRVRRRPTPRPSGSHPQRPAHSSTRRRIDAPAGVTELDATDNIATDTDTLTPRADLSITKTDGLTTVDAGTSLAYTIVATNSGPSTVAGATVTDTLPASLTGAAWTCTSSAGSSCPAAGTGNINASVDLASGGTATFTVTATVSPAATGSVTNTATVTPPGSVPDPTPGNNTATDVTSITRRADLSITKTDGTPTAVAGSSVTYTIVARNSGPSARSARRSPTTSRQR